jgi:undecaprenyl-diphosphatase
VAIALAFPQVWSWVLASVWVPVMALSRTYLLVHWATDVLAAAVLRASVALIVAAIVTALFRMFTEPKSPPTPPLRTAIPGVQLNRMETPVS